ncbi:MAG TPA: ABC transporter permease [Acidimicrobiales bacterium]|nr:ABC transporter permease [Acidimicrobiales bacterium]
MSAQVVRYRLRAALRRRLGAHVAIAALVAVLGGTAMASIAAARRTQSSFPRYLASTHPSDVTMTTYGTSPDSPANGYSPALEARLAQIPGVAHVESWTEIFGAPLRPDGAPDLGVEADLSNVASVDGMYFDQDRAVAVHGRMARPERANEFVATAEGARVLGLHVGAAVPMGFYTGAQTNQPGFGTAKVPPAVRVDMTLVGIVVLNDGVVQDEVDRFPAMVIFTPAVTRSFVHPGDSAGSWFGFRLTNGARDIASVERRAVALLPPGAVSYFRTASLGTGKVERTVKPEAIALAVFGAIAALAALVIVTLAISRELQVGDHDRDVLRSMGAHTSVVLADGLIGVIGAVVFGAVLACALAVVASPLSPLGPVRHVYPGRGIAFDWSVLGVGALVLVVGLAAVAVALAVVSSPERVARRRDVPRSSAVARAAASSGMPPAAVVGLRFALEPGRGRAAVPVRSALVGSVMAMVVLVATLTFGSSLRTLVARPSLYGWNWDYALQSSQDVPPQSIPLLAKDPLVTASAPYVDLNVEINGLSVPVLIGPTDPAVSPPLLSGHAVAGPDQVVLGDATLRALHTHVGATVVASMGTPSQAPLYVPPTRLLVVGTATLPAVAGSGSFGAHTGMGTGGLLSVGIAPQLQQSPPGSDPTLNGPPLVFVRLAHGVSAAAGRADIQRVADAGTQAFAADPNAPPARVEVLPVQQPAEIVNYRATGATPAVLAAGLALGAIAALGLTLAASVVRRRRELAMLKTLGFTRRQLAAAVAWQATVAAVVGAVIGVPLGIALGRQLWDAFARDISAVPHPTVPASVLLVPLGALVLANVVAAVPGRVAARTPAALVLRAE